MQKPDMPMAPNADTDGPPNGKPNMQPGDKKQPGMPMQPMHSQAEMDRMSKSSAA